MADIARDARVQKATVEVYTLDGFVAGAPLDYEYLMGELNVSQAKFQKVKRELKQPGELKLRTVKDKLENSNISVSYNQIKLVIACLIRGYDLS